MAWDRERWTHWGIRTAALMTTVVGCSEVREYEYVDGALAHPLGWAVPGEGSSHGEALCVSQWSFSECVPCHDLADRARADVGYSSCLDCHAGGPTDCDACHGRDGDLTPSSGRHEIHTKGGPVLGRAVDCDACHRVPAGWDDGAHISDDAEGGCGKGRAEVVLGQQARASLAGLEDRRPGPASYDPATGRCLNVACHAGAHVDAEAAVPGWWSDGGERDGCATCHGLPPGGAVHDPSLTVSDCPACHGRVVDDEGNVVDPARHGDAALSLGTSDESCSACHGSNDNAAPPRALEGSVDVAIPAVGAHQAHVRGGLFSDAMPCEDCHRALPGESFYARVRAPGHIDHDGRAEVFRSASGTLLSGLNPAFASSTPLAAANGAPATYDESTGICEVYCHGAGEALATDQTPGLVRAPGWAPPSPSSFACGDCHGLPPATPAHADYQEGWECYFCHTASIAPDGSFLRRRGQLLHINGGVD